MNLETCCRQVKLPGDTNYTNEHVFVKIRAIGVNSGLRLRQAARSRGGELFLGHKLTRARCHGAVFGDRPDLDLRNEARKAKNFVLGDQIRKRLAELNITLEDRPGGKTDWRLG